MTFGKPNPFVFENAEAILGQFLPSNVAYDGSYPFKTLYMIGDNPSVDIKGARQVGTTTSFPIVVCIEFAHPYHHAKSLALIIN